MSSFEDPKILFTAKLVNEQEFIRQLLNNNHLSIAAKHLATMLLTLQIPDEEKEMKELLKVFTPTNYIEFTTEDLYTAFTLTAAYLNRTYFADFHKAKPKYGSEGKM